MKTFCTTIACHRRQQCVLAKNHQGETLKYQDLGGSDAENCQHFDDGLKVFHELFNKFLHGTGT